MRAALATSNSKNEEYKTKMSELKKSIADHASVLEAIDKVNSLVSFKMADLVNKAVKAGNYFDVEDG